MKVSREEVKKKEHFYCPSCREECLWPRLGHYGLFKVIDFIEPTEEQQKDTTLPVVLRMKLETILRVLLKFFDRAETLNTPSGSPHYFAPRKNKNTAAKVYSPSTVHVNSLLSILSAPRDEYMKKVGIGYDASHLCGPQTGGCCSPAHIVFEPHKINMSRKECVAKGRCLRTHASFPDCLLEN